MRNVEKKNEKKKKKIGKIAESHCHYHSTVVYVWVCMCLGRSLRFYHDENVPNEWEHWKQENQRQPTRHWSETFGPMILQENSIY